MTKGSRHKSFYFISAIVGLLLFIWEIDIYRQTIISIKAPFILTLVVSIITFFIIQKDYRKTYPYSSLFFPLMQSVISFGFISCYLFMALNFYLADSNMETKSFPILTKHTIGTKNPQPAIEIDYDGTEKQLVFYSGQQDQVDTSKQVLLTVKKGLFGFDVLNDITLK